MSPILFWSGAEHIGLGGTEAQVSDSWCGQEGSVMSRREGGQKRTKSPNSSERGAFNRMEAISEEFSRSGQDWRRGLFRHPLTRP